MALKSLIQRLLDSRTTPSEAAHNAAPGTGDIGIAGTEYTCPSDGYITALSNGAVAGGFNLSLKRNGLNVQGGPQEIQFAEWTQARMIPVAKGDRVTLELYNQNVWEWRFIPAIGGGYLRSFVSTVCKRGESCLSSLSLCLPRSFCKVKSLGLQNNQLLSSIRALISLAQAPRISLVTSLRATAGQLLDATQIQSQLLKSKSRTGRWHLLPFLTETLRELGSVVTLKKGHRLSSCAVAEVQPIILFGSTKQVQTFNPLTGGALC